MGIETKALSPQIIEYIREISNNWFKAFFMPGSGSVLQIIEHVAAMIEPNLTNPVDPVCRLDLIYRKGVVILPFSFELLQVRFRFDSYLRPNRESFFV